MLRFISTASSRLSYSADAGKDRRGARFHAGRERAGNGSADPERALFQDERSSPRQHDDQAAIGIDDFRHAAASGK
jgi:hypothetical protein